MAVATQKITELEQFVPSKIHSINFLKSKHHDHCNLILNRNSDNICGESGLLSSEITRVGWSRIGMATSECFLLFLPPRKLLYELLNAFDV